MINVPAMVTAGMPVHYAVATSTVVVLFTSAAGSGIHAMLGHIDLGYALFLSIGSVIGAYAGKQTVPRIPDHHLRKEMCVLLACIAVLMFIDTISGC